MKNSITSWGLQRLADFFSKRPKLLIALVLVYFISPFDLVPEAWVGPLGYIDDFFILLLPLFLRRLVQNRSQKSVSSEKTSEDFYDTTAR